MLNRPHFFCLAILCSVGIFVGCGKSSRVDVKKQKVDDIELAYYTRGTGDPLLMIMGFKGTMAAWDPALIEELAKNYTVIVFDNRGVGLSSDTQEDKTTIEQMAKDTVGLIQALGYEKVHLLGWSMGSMIAMQIALDHPELLHTLVLSSPNPGGRFQSLRKTNAYAKLLSPELPMEESLSLIFPENEKGRIASSEFVKRLTKAIESGTVPDDLNINTQTIERQANALQLRGRDNAIYENLPFIKVPTLVASGLDDVLDQPENARIVASRIPFSWTAYFPNAGHAFASQDYLDFSRLIKLFIDTQKKSF